MTVSSEGAAHSSAAFASVNTLCGVDFSLLCLRGPEAASVRGAAHISAVSKNVNTLCSSLFVLRRRVDAGDAGASVAGRALCSVEMDL